MATQRVRRTPQELELLQQSPLYHRHRVNPCGVPLAFHPPTKFASTLQDQELVHIPRCLCLPDEVPGLGRHTRKVVAACLHPKNTNERDVSYFARSCTLRRPV